MWKCLSPVLDYFLNFNLLQFQYEQWLYETVSGSIDSGKKYNLCPASVLSQKPFCHSFWRWLHALLINTVDRLGYPDFFLTMSASEWDLPKPWWIASRFQQHGFPPTRDSFAEAISISHSLQQFVSAYFCSEDRGKWTDHLFFDAKHPRKKIVKAYFWRLEFQRRGTPHLHCLVWIDQSNALDMKRFCAFVPQHHPVVAHNVFATNEAAKHLMTYKSRLFWGMAKLER